MLSKCYHKNEIDQLSVALNGSRISCLLAWYQAELSIKSEAATNQMVDPTDLNKVFKTTKKDEMDAFSSKIMHGQTKTMLFRNNMPVMTQILNGGDGPHLPHCLSVVSTYTEVTTGSKQVVVTVKNLMVVPITIAKSIKVT